MPLLRTGEAVPDFTADTQLGSLNFHDFITGNWCLFFAHPADFTPVCTTEFGMVSKLSEEFQARNCKILGLSVDSVESHELWIKDINETQDTQVRFPIVADESGAISQMFSFSDQLSTSVKITSRVLYLIDPNRKVQLALEYPSNVGRNFYEVIRTLDALQLGSMYPVGTPANWKAGDDVFILPEIGDEVAKEKFPMGFTSIKPYLRITAAPDVEIEEKES